MSRVHKSLQRKNDLWDYQKTVRLIEAIQVYHSIWRWTYYHHRRGDGMLNRLKHIARQLKVNAQLVIEKVENLWDQLIVEVKQEIEDNTYKSNWPYYKSFRFIVDDVLLAQKIREIIRTVLSKYPVVCRLQTSPENLDAWDDIMKEINSLIDSTPKITLDSMSVIMLWNNFFLDNSIHHKLLIFFNQSFSLYSFPRIFHFFKREELTKTEHQGFGILDDYRIIAKIKNPCEPPKKYIFTEYCTNNNYDIRDESGFQNVFGKEKKFPDRLLVTCVSKYSIFTVNPSSNTKEHPNDIYCLRDGTTWDAIVNDFATLGHCFTVEQLQCQWSKLISRTKKKLIIKNIYPKTEMDEIEEDIAFYFSSIIYPALTPQFEDEVLEQILKNIDESIRTTTGASSSNKGKSATNSTETSGNDTTIDREFLKKLSDEEWIKLVKEKNKRTYSSKNSPSKNLSKNVTSDDEVDYIKSLLMET